MLPSVGIYICCLEQVCLTMSSMNRAGMLQRVASMLHRASVASAVINADGVGMLEQVYSNAAENSVIDSTCINQSYRAHMLPRVGFHAADTANMLSSAGSDSAKVRDSAGLHAGRCKPVMYCAKRQTVQVLIPQREHAIARQCRQPSMLDSAGIHAANSNHTGLCRHPCCTKLGIPCEAAGLLHGVCCRCRHP